MYLCISSIILLATRKRYFARAEDASDKGARERIRKLGINIRFVCRLANILNTKIKQQKTITLYSLAGAHVTSAHTDIPRRRTAKFISYTERPAGCGRSTLLWRGNLSSPLKSRLHDGVPLDNDEVATALVPSLPLLGLFSVSRDKMSAARVSRRCCRSRR